mmetsp:Transcript_340/g.611  ORF Transcript_340/g.611 Transcript_340/m.611 type:complete len:181 (-) Transcript_340:251-793(-)
MSSQNISHPPALAWIPCSSIITTSRTSKSVCSKPVQKGLSMMAATPKGFGFQKRGKLDKLDKNETERPDVDYSYNPNDLIPAETDSSVPTIAPGDEVDPETGMSLNQLLAMEKEIKRERKKKNKLNRCEKCNGVGKVKCPFCEGTTKMVGFTGQLVPCVPCNAVGHLSYKCKECAGLGFV